jgi:hypothetical protein
MGGSDTLRGSTFQIVQALSDVVDLLARERFGAIRLEGQDDVIDYEALDLEGQRIAVWQAKTRQDSDSWGAAELASVLLAWDEVDGAAEVDFTFVTDGRLGPSGQELDALIRAFQRDDDAEALSRGASKLGRSGVTLPSLEVARRVRILPRMGTAEDVLARLEMQILRLLERSRIATTDDAADAANRLFRRFFLVGGQVDLARRVVSRNEIVAALGINEESLRGGLPWSNATVTAYRAAIARTAVNHSRVLPPYVVEIASEPAVLRMMTMTAADHGNEREPIDALLGEPLVALTGASGAGKTISLANLANRAAMRGVVPVQLSAAGHVPGSLPRRIRNAIENALDRQLSPGAVEAVMALPELLLLVDGISEVPEETQAALRADLGTLNAQRPLRVIATGRDLPIVIAVLQVIGRPTAYRLSLLNSSSRRDLASRLPDVRPGVVEAIEQQLGDAVDNPMLFLMALAVSGDCVPSSRAAVHEEFLRGLVARSGVAHPELTMSAFGVAWARLIGMNRRTTDHYGWLVALNQAITRLSNGPVWRGAELSGTELLAKGQALGLVSRIDPDGGLAPLHDSFADFLAGRAMSRGDAEFPPHLSSMYDEAVLFAVDISGLSDWLALRIASENPLLACKVSHHLKGRGQAAELSQVGQLLIALVGDSDLPMLGESRGLRLHYHPDFLGIVFAGEGHETIDEEAFDALLDEHPAIMVPPGTTSLQLAVRLWATAMSRAQRPAIRLYQELPSQDAEAAAAQVAEYAKNVDSEIMRLVAATIPASLRGLVMSAVGPRGLVAVVADPTPTGIMENREMPMRYRRDRHYQVTPTGQFEHAHHSLSGITTVEHFMRRHPAQQGANEISEVLKVLSEYTWPER